MCSQPPINPNTDPPILRQTDTPNNPNTQKPIKPQLTTRGNMIYNTYTASLLPPPTGGRRGRRLLRRRYHTHSTPQPRRRRVHADLGCGRPILGRGWFDRPPACMRLHRTGPDQGGAARRTATVVWHRGVAGHPTRSPGLGTTHASRSRSRACARSRGGASEAGSANFRAAWVPRSAL